MFLLLLSLHLLFHGFKFLVHLLVLLQHHHLIFVSLFQRKFKLNLLIRVDHRVDIDVVVVRSDKQTVSMLQHSWLRDQLPVYLNRVLLGIFAVWIKLCLAILFIINQHALLLRDADSAKLDLRLVIWTFLAEHVFAISEGVLEHTGHLGVLVDVPDLRDVLDAGCFLLSSFVLSLLLLQLPLEVLSLLFNLPHHLFLLLHFGFEL